MRTTRSRVWSERVSDFSLMARKYQRYAPLSMYYFTVCLVVILDIYIDDRIKQDATAQSLELEEGDMYVL